MLAPVAREALLELPRPLDPDEPVFKTTRGRLMSGRTLHYYWSPVSAAWGDPSLDFYALRHSCGSWLLNELELPPQDVAEQLGHDDGGVLVLKLYGHPSKRLARERLKRAMGDTGTAPAPISAASRRHSGR